MKNQIFENSIIRRICIQRLFVSIPILKEIGGNDDKVPNYGEHRAVLLSIDALLHLKWVTICYGWF